MTWQVFPSLSSVLLLILFEQPDSDDELLKTQAQEALQHKIHSQSIKKSKKNQSRLPRTVGLRTLSEMTGALTKAGLDPSRITDRATMLAKAAGVKRKRAREADDDVEMEDGDEDEGEAGEGEWMDVDGEEAPKIKRAKGNRGTAVAPAHPRAPTKNRQLTGMRDQGVSNQTILFRGCSDPFLFLASISSHQITRLCPATEELPGQGRRGGSRYFNKDGVLYILLTLQHFFDLGFY